MSKTAQQRRTAGGQSSRSRSLLALAVGALALGLGRAILERVRSTRTEPSVEGVAVVPIGDGDVVWDSCGGCGPGEICIPIAIATGSGDLSFVYKCVKRSVSIDELLAEARVSIPAEPA